MKNTREMFFKSLLQMQQCFTIYEFLEACTENGLTIEVIAVEFLKENSQSSGSGGYHKLSTPPISKALNVVSFDTAKGIVEEQGYVVCKKEITLTPI